MSEWMKCMGRGIRVGSRCNASCTPTCACVDLYFSVHARTKIGAAPNGCAHACLHFHSCAHRCE